MPLIESKPDALAFVYARALYEVAGEKAAAEQALGQLEDILELTRSDPAFNEFLASRVVPTAARESALRRILTGRVSDHVLNFLLVVNAKDRLGHLPAIVGALDSLVQEAFGRVEVDVFTAGPASADALETVKKALTARLGKDVVVHPYTDPAMIGGVKLRIGDQLIDGSVASRLRQVRGQLSTRGQAAVRARAGDIIGD